MNAPILDQQILLNGHPAIITKIRQRPHGHAGFLNVTIFMPPSPRPREVFGRSVVGQWSTKETTALWFPPTADYRDTVGNPLNILENTDPSTYVDYRAWLDAFDRVYSAS